MEGFWETSRLLLRSATEADVDNLVELDSDPEVMRFINGGKPSSPETVRSSILPRMLARVGGFGYWVAVERSSGSWLGWFSLWPTGDEAELGYRLRRSAWGKGYATEGARALVHKGFTELGCRRIVAQTMTVNVGSRRVMEKAGLTYVRTFHCAWPEVIEGSELGDVEYACESG